MSKKYFINRKIFQYHYLVIGIIIDTSIYQQFCYITVYVVISNWYNIVTLQENFESGDLYCNATFDGYTCWDYTKAGTKTFGQCPLFMIHQFGHQPGLPFKDCNTDGTWYRHPETQSPWTNYSPCSETDKVRRANSVLYVYFTGYGVSIVALVIALFIFAYFRQLKCTRVTIHKHLFLSYILTAVLWISYYGASSFDPHVVQENPIWCRILHVLAQYVTVCNYAWMFCEGFYLHTLLVLTFTNEKRLLIICYVIAWGVPVIPSIIYSVLRSTNAAVDNNCWHDDTFLIWIFSGPITLSLIINVLFLFNIVRILCLKVRSIRQQASYPLRQSVRATCILIPLLGIQYVVLPFRPPAGNEHGQYVYDMASASLSSFQGFLVSLLFCFLNGEVLNLLQKETGVLRRRLSRSDMAKTYDYSAVQISENQLCEKDAPPINNKTNQQEQFINITTPV